MIFLGDLACPPEKADEFNRAIEDLDVLANEVVVLNLEAVIPEGDDHKAGTLYNHEAVLDSMRKKAKRVIVSMANNHMYDYPEAILRTKELLEKHGVGVFGLLDSTGQIAPYEFENEGTPYALFGHCWNLYTATNPNRINSVRIVDCEYDDFLKTVGAYIGRNPGRKVYCFMHWNYDMEVLPFPMHIRLSHDLIDAGVEGVIGSHSHVTHSVELYRGKPVAYCLGNFYLPSGIYFDGKLAYPEKSKDTIGLRVGKYGADILRFDTDRGVPVSYVDSVPVSGFPALPTSDVEAYAKLFRRQRAKRFLVPVFNSYSGRMYGLQIKWAIQRINLIKLLSKFLHK